MIDGSEWLFIEHQRQNGSVQMLTHTHTHSNGRSRNIDRFGLRSIYSFRSNWQLFMQNYALYSGNNLMLESEFSTNEPRLDCLCGWIDNIIYMIEWQSDKQGKWRKSQTSKTVRTMDLWFVASSPVFLWRPGIEIWFGRREMGWVGVRSEIESQREREAKNDR